MYVYLKTDDSYVVGTFVNGEWYPESDYDNPEQAAQRVSYLNGTFFSVPQEKEQDKSYSIDEICEVTSMIQTRLGYGGVEICAWARMWNEYVIYEEHTEFISGMEEDEYFPTRLSIRPDDSEGVVFEELDVIKIIDVLRSGDSIAIAEILGKISSIIEKHIDDPGYNHYKENDYEPIF